MITGREQPSVRESSNNYLQALVEGLQYELRQRNLRIAEQQQYIAQLEQQIVELKRQAASAFPLPTPPPFVKPNVPERRRRSPGRELGHPVALRPMPKKIDCHQRVPLPKDRAKKPICPHCRTRLTQLRKHRRIIEDLIHSTVETTWLFSCALPGRSRLAIPTPLHFQALAAAKPDRPYSPGCAG